MRKSDEMLRKLREQGELLEIPESLKPEQMRRTLEEKKGRPKARKRYFYPAVAAVFCFCLTAGIFYGTQRAALSSHGGKLSGERAAAEAFLSKTPEEVVEEELKLPQMTYGDIYAKLSESWDVLSMQKNMRMETETIMNTAGAMASVEEAEDLGASKDVFGKTNIQVEQVDEADRIKNDGRYLYQIAYRTEEGEENWGIQILDTGGELREAAFLDDFDYVDEFYVWEDLLIAVESKYLDFISAAPLAREDMAYKYAYMRENQYHEITVYDIADRTSPRKLKTFTLKGAYETSRISDGYFYGISRFMADPGNGEEDYGSYVPTLDGKPMQADRIYCPENISGNSFLVLVSIDLKNPVSFADNRAVLMGDGIYYVSRKNIYMTQYHSIYAGSPKTEGTVTDSTKIMKFAYRDGKFYAQASGEIPGRLNDSFSLDEYNGYLRAVTTLQECKVKEVTDDRTGENIGFDYSDMKESNGLYVLSRDLSVKGKVEGLAGDEMVYSARFMGNTGYFVTFRQVDPLFAVDLSDPADPTVLGELKVSGFSEYLHFYGEDRLLGIGMEADEETGRQEGMKLSMFDLSDPAELTEEAKLNLKEYNYSEALYNHRAVMIDTEENLIGFSAEGSSRGEYWKRYLVFSYENGAFVKKLEADIREEDGGYYNTRGTFIGNVIYLLSENGSARVYDRESGKMVEELKMTEDK